jgi:ribosomal protein L21
MDMFAVIRTGGKQYKVAKNDVIVVEKLLGDAGDEVDFTDVLALNDGSATQFGSPVVGNALVTAEVLEQARGDKIIIFKKKRRKNYRRKNGHRQDLTVLRILDILATPASVRRKRKRSSRPRKRNRRPRQRPVPPGHGRAPKRPRPRKRLRPPKRSRPKSRQQKNPPPRHLHVNPKGD